MDQFEKQPPGWVISVLSFIVHRDFREEIEGDLLEKYQRDLQKYGPAIARRRLYLEMLSMAKPKLIFNVNRSTMQSRNWLLLLLVLLLVAIAPVAPFLPGSTNDFSPGISRFAQTIGYIGLPFLLFGLIWLIIEIRNKNGQRLNRWTNGYYPSLLTLSPVVLFVPLKLASLILNGDAFSILPLTIIISITAFFIYRIQKLKKKTQYSFNPAPLYIVLIPAIALLSSKFVLEKAAGITRERAIINTEPLIAAIEKYKTENGEYPETLESVIGKYIQDIPTFNVMGTRACQYVKRNSSFELTIERLWHWNATEVVVYNTLGDTGVKGNYENYPTNHMNWSYYFAD
ncbi:permease prefix domain 2-containing transporter [Flavitalea antarctica]